MKWLGRLSSNNVSSNRGKQIMTKKKTINVTRRQLLRGAGGVTLGLPFLPSIVPVSANAANVVYTGPKRFAAICVHHGGVYEKSMFPSESMLTTTADVAPGHAGRWGALKRTVSGNDASLSEVMKAPATALSDRLVSKMNVLWGVDYAYGGGHNSGGFLGNYDATDGAEGKMAPRPTIDQVMAWSPAFYKSLSGVSQRAMVGPSDADSSYHSGNSFNYSNPSAKSGTIQKSPSFGSAQDLFKALFMGQMTTPVAARKPIVDHVIEDFKRLRNSNRRMSPDDRQRLDDHMDRMAELQRTVAAQTNPVASCKDVKAPATSVEPYRTFNDVFVAAFLCGASRIAVIAPNEANFVTFPGSWHQDSAHKWNTDPAAQLRLVAANQAVFREVFVDLIQKLDVEEAPGQTVLDNSLVQMSNECSEETHNSNSIPMFTAGSAGGFLKTGLLCDYRNQAAKSKFVGQYGKISGFSGISNNRWLSTVLQAMGVPRSEFERPGELGYGDQRLDTIYSATYLPAVNLQQGDVMPFLKA
jgi:hypothetical protein